MCVIVNIRWCGMVVAATCERLHELQGAHLSQRPRTRNEYGAQVRRFFTVKLVEGPSYAVWKSNFVLSLLSALPHAYCKWNSPKSLSSSTWWQTKHLINRIVLNYFMYIFSAFEWRFFLSLSVLFFNWQVLLERQRERTRVWERERERERKRESICINYFSLL